MDLVIDHSVMIDEFGNPRAFQMNVDREYERNMERYTFLKWGQSAFDNFRVVPPGTGICHQVNLEYLAKTIWSDTDQSGEMVAYPDTLVGTDSHTTMVNGAAVLGWGVGGIEAEAAMLGQPISMLIPEVVGFELTGEMMEGTTGTDLVLKVVEMLRAKGVVGKFVEFYGAGLDTLPLADRATIANMAPEYGATCGFFPIDGETLRYLRNTGRPEEVLDLVETYAKENGFWRGADYAPVYTDTLSLDMCTIVPAISGPKRPQDYTTLDRAARAFFEGGLRVPRRGRIAARHRHGVGRTDPRCADRSAQDGQGRRRGVRAARRLGRDRLDHLLHEHLQPLRDDRRGAGGAQGARTGPDPQAMGQDLARAGGRRWFRPIWRPRACREDLDAIGFNLVGYGCTTCIGNSGPLQPEISKAISDNDLIATSVLSGNRNFEGRISPDVRANYLASPPLVVAYALAGDMNIDISSEPLGQTPEGRDVYLKDVWPTQKEIADLVEATVTREGVPDEIRRCLQGRREMAGRGGARSRRPMTGPPPRPTSRTRPISKAWARSPARSRISRARGVLGGSWAT